MEIIKDIADQTNLLAFNVAIEAARASEQESAAVLTDEVGSLAGRTQKSPLEIHQMIAKLQSGAMQPIKAIGESNEKARSVAD
jgi:methyl-accepting chemotaxis protein